MCGPKPIFVGPKAIWYMVKSPLLVRPVSLDCMTGQAKAYSSPEAAVVQTHLRIHR